MEGKRVLGKYNLNYHEINTEHYQENVSKKRDH